MTGADARAETSADAGRPRAARWVLVCWGLGLVGALSQIPFSIVNGVDHGNADYFYGAIGLIFVIGVLSIGVVILQRQPANRIGRLFLLMAGAAVLWNVSQGYANYALVTAPGSLSFGSIAAWIYQWSIVPLMALFIPIFLLFPDGRPPTPRWRPVLWLWAAGSIVTTLGFALTTHRILLGDPHTTGIYVRNPFGLYGHGPLVDTVGQIGGRLTVATGLAAAVAIVRRFRRADPETRQQIKWLAFVGVAFLATLIGSIIVLLATGLDDVDWAGNLAFGIYVTILLVGLPAACAVAILKYRLYDLDVVVKKTVVFGLLAVFISGVYAVVVGGVSALIGSGGNTIASFVAAAVLAVAFQPVRDRVRRFADRLVYGRRATPYEVLADFSAQVAGTYATEDVLARMAQVLQAGTGAEVARVWLRVGAELRPEAAAPASVDRGSALPLADVGLPTMGNGEHAVEVREGDELLGALSVVMPAADPMTPARARLVEDLARQAQLVLRNVRLIEELRASRQRLVAAQDEERRKIERDLHDGAQQQLVALSVQLKLARTVLDRDPAKAGGMLDALQGTAGGALEDLRDLARGIFPPLLADQGLVAALGSQARKAVVPTTVRGDGLGRYPRDVEAAVYFCTLEALNNVAKYAGATNVEVLLTQTSGHLSFTVRDDGAGFDPSATGYGTGLRGMADRLDAIGGDLTVDSAPGRGTVVSGRVPVAARSAS